MLDKKKKMGSVRAAGGPNNGERACTQTHFLAVCCVGSGVSSLLDPLSRIGTGSQSILASQ